jgi:hypothetical protein
MDNAQTQSMVAYENAPKEVNTHRGMPSTKKQFGKGNKMPQDVATKGYVKKALEHHVKTMHRHKEHR